MSSQDNCKNYDLQTLLAKISSFNIWLRNVFKEMMMNNQYVKRKKIGEKQTQENTGVHPGGAVCEMLMD